LFNYGHQKGVWLATTARYGSHVGIGLKCSQAVRIADLGTDLNAFGLVMIIVARF